MSVTHKKGIRIEKWFDDLVASIRSHQLQLETKTADPKIENFYKTIFSGSSDDLVNQSRYLAQQHFIPKIIFDYAKSIQKHPPKRLAFDFNDSEVLVWAEIDDDNFEQEKHLILVEAKINSKYHPYGFDMKSTIVEKSDNLPVPNHYKKLID